MSVSPNLVSHYYLTDQCLDPGGPQTPDEHRHPLPRAPTHRAHEHRVNAVCSRSASRPRPGLLLQRDGAGPLHLHH